jgi:predicted dehydrogenase
MHVEAEHSNRGCRPDRSAPYRARASERFVRSVAIVDPSPAVVEIAAAAGVHLFADIAALFAAQRPDGVILATPNQLHVEQALACIEAGVPALIEKPVAHSLKEGERLLQAAKTRA